MRASISSWICTSLWLSLIALTQAQTVTVTATPTSPSPPSYTSLDDFKDTVLSVSNSYRREHSAGHLVWNETLTNYALNWARGCKWEHSHGPYGENLAFGYPNATAAICAWGDERTDYNFHKPTGYTEQTGHFTQLVWRATAQVGCAAVDCGYEAAGDAEKDEDGEYRRAQGWYVVCEYAPAGNVMGVDGRWFRTNVRPERSGDGDEGWHGHGDGHGHGHGHGDECDGAPAGVDARGLVGWTGIWLTVVHGAFLMLWQPNE